VSRLDGGFESSLLMRVFLVDFHTKAGDLHKRGIELAERVGGTLAEANALSWAVSEVAEAVDSCDAALSARLTSEGMSSPTARLSISMASQMSPQLLASGRRAANDIEAARNPPAGLLGIEPAAGEGSAAGGPSSSTAVSSTLSSPSPSPSSAPPQVSASAVAASAYVASSQDPQPTPHFTTMLRLLATQVARTAERGAQDAVRQREFLWDLVNEYIALSAGARDVLAIRATLLRDYQKGNASTQAAHEKLIKLYLEREARELKKGASDDKLDAKVRAQEEAFANESTKSVAAKLAFLRHSDAAAAEMVRFRSLLERDMRQNLLSYLDARMNDAAQAFQEWHDLADELANPGRSRLSPQ
jgi:hypothetical protein